jgi:hypothetical protein
MSIPFQTTTSKFQVISDSFSFDDCQKMKRMKKNERKITNPRYKSFDQTHFTAGDEEQFHTYRDMTNGIPYVPKIDISSNIFNSVDFISKIHWDNYKDLHALCVDNTFSYLFHKFKKGIFVKIKDNKLAVFLPFSKYNYTNEWGHKMKFDPSRFKDMNDFFRHISSLQNYRYKGQEIIPNNWYANNCLIRYESPLNEGDSGVSNMSDMFNELCRTREVPDMEFFVNRRDFPLLKRNLTEPYDNMFDSDNAPLLSHKYDKYAPILGGATTSEFADISIPTWKDWSRVSAFEGKFFSKTCDESPSEINSIPWGDKIPIAMFRGGSTGCGVTKETNPRIHLAHMSHSPVNELVNVDGKNIPFLDAGITNWNLRPRKIKNEEFLQTIDISKCPLVNKMSPQQQSNYKYIINVDGHVTAFRLSLELSMSSVILLVESKYSIWYMSMLEPNVHYIPIKADLSNLISTITWCRLNDDRCKQIAQNAKEFYNKYLNKNAILDYLQNIMISLKNEMGVYLYNYKNPLQFQFDHEKNFLDTYNHSPTTNKTMNNISTVPYHQQRSHSLFQGVEWVFNMVKKGGGLPTHLLFYKDLLFSTKSTRIHVGKFAGLDLVIKNSNLEKNNENIHEIFIAQNCINDLSKKVPNFLYILGGYTASNSSVSVITEYIRGPTFANYIESDEFSVDTYVFILLQLCLSLQVAQNSCGFVHWDLMPWNIMIMKLNTPITVEYLISHDEIYSVTTNIVPVIIDYGKSHVIHNSKHYGFINPYKTSTVQDPLTLLLSSLKMILRRKKPISEFDTNIILGMSNFISNTAYRTTNFENKHSLESFINHATKYSNIINSNKHELEHKTPMDLFNHILQYNKFNIKRVENVKISYNIGNPKQVFDYILSDNNEERINSYTDIYKGLKHCIIPQPNNLFLVYYTAQTLTFQFNSLFNLLFIYLNLIHVDNSKYTTLYKNCIDYLNYVYRDKINTVKETVISFDIEPEFYETLIPAPYTENTFLIPNDILNMLNNQLIKKRDIELNMDLISYKDLIEYVLAMENEYKISGEDKNFYLENFRDLLNCNSVNMRNNIANSYTLTSLSKRVYTTNNQELKKYNTEYYKSEKYNPEFYNKLRVFYKKILSHIQ